MHELLDIVSANDTVLGCATRTEIHRTNRLHRAVHMLVQNPNGEVYLQKRAATKDVNPNCWDSSAAGHVDSGEHYLDAAVRELMEELGIAEPPSAFVEFHRRQPDENNGFEHQRFYAIQSSQVVRPCPNEIAEGRWWNREAVDTWVASDDFALTNDLKKVWPVYCSEFLD